MRLDWHVGLGRDLGMAFWAMTFFEASYGAYNSIWPLWIADRGAPIAMVGVVLGSAGLIRPFVLGPSSWLTERFDRRLLLITARALGIVGLLIAAFAGSWPILFLTVVLTAMAELVFPVMQSYVAERSHENRARAFSLVVNVGPSAALIVTPLLSGLLIAQWGMKSALFLAACASLVSIIVLWRMDLTRQPDPDDADDGTTPSYRAAFANRPVRGLLIIHATTILSLAIGVTLIPIFLQDQRGMDASLISTLGAGAAVGTMLFGLWVARTPRLAANPMLAAAIACVGMVVSLVVFAVSGALAWIALAFVLRGGLFATWAMLLAHMSEICPGRIRSRAFAMMEILGGGAFSFGPVIASLLYDLQPHLPLVVGAVTGSVMAAWMFLIQRRDRNVLRTAPIEPAEVVA